MTNKRKGTAAAQEAAASNTTSTASGNTANVATISTAKKMPPKKRIPAEKKEKKASKFLNGVLIHVATVSYNHWREFVNEILNGEDKSTPRIARFIKDETALNTKWGGFIATNAENVEKVTAILSAWTAENNARPETEQYADLWEMLEHFQTVEPKVRAPRKSKVKTEETPA